MKFDKGFVLQDGKRDESEFSGTWHYPCCCEHNGKLYVIYSANTGDGNTTPMWVGFSRFKTSSSVLIKPNMAEVFKPFELMRGALKKAK